MHSKPSLLERAAEVYDFGTGLPLRTTDDLPPARERSVRAAPRIQPQPEPEPAPAPAAPQPVARQPQPAARTSERTPERPAQQPRASIAHQQVTLDHELLANGGYLLPDVQGGNLVEELRLIKRRLLSATDARVADGDDTARLVLVASGRPGEGKSFMAANLALSLAGEQDRRVLLIDGDNAKPHLLSSLGVDGDHLGFVDALRDASLDPEALVLDTDIAGLSILPAGARAQNVPELLASARTQEVFARLLAADPRRIILIDSSPVLAATTAGVLASHVGQTLVVVKADATSEADLKESLDLLSACDHLSLVLNNTAFQVGSRRYGRYEEYR